MTLTKRPDLVAFAVVLLCVAGTVVLAALGVTVPDFVTYAGTTALGIGGGVALQGSTTAAAASSSSPADPVPAAAPAPLDPTTGIIPRVASHAP